MDLFTFAKPVQLAPGLWVLEEMGSNVYVIKGTERALVLDTAYGLTDFYAAARHLCGDLPLVLVNSHAHPDHNVGNHRFAEAFVGRFDEPNSHKAYDEPDKQHLIDFMGARLSGYPFDRERWHPGPAKTVHPLKNGDKIDLGGICFTVLETPGHTLGSIALFEPEKRWLFTGDTLLTWEVWGQLANSAALCVYAESLEALAAIGSQVDWVLPAHSSAEDTLGTGRFTLPARILSVYAEGTRAIVNGTLEGRPYEEKNPRFAGCRYALFEIGGMAYDPKRIR